MKLLRLRYLTVTLTMMCASIGTWAYDFAVDGICYNVVSASKHTVEVTYRTADYKSYAGEITLPETVRWNNEDYAVARIGNFAFKKCTGLSSITLPDALRTIGTDAFWGCTELQTIIVPDSVTSIGMGAFSGCSRMGAAVFGASVQRISMYAFGDCISLAAVNLPASVVYVGEYAFSACDALKMARVPAEAEVESNAFKDSPTKVTRYTP